VAVIGYPRGNILLIGLDVVIVLVGLVRQFMACCSSPPTRCGSATWMSGQGATRIGRSGRIASPNMSRGKSPVRLLHPIVTLAVGLAIVVGCSASPTSVGTPTPTSVIVAVASPTPGLDSTPLPATPTPASNPTPYPTAWPTGSPPGDILLPPSWPPQATPAPTPVPTDGGGLIAVPTGNSPPTRIVIPALGIDLPVIKGDPAYPKCNVAQYMTNFVNPGQPGTTYIYGHARTGMFLPLLHQSEINNGAAMIGMLVKLYTADKKLHEYRINIVKRHATDFSLALDLAPGQHRLILQTSEGPHGTIPKLQVAAKPIGVYAATAAEALPKPHPVTCGT
jgi:hypothetical protein